MILGAIELDDACRRRSYTRGKALDLLTVNYRDISLAVSAAIRFILKRPTFDIDVYYLIMTSRIKSAIASRHSRTEFDEQTRVCSICLNLYYENFNGNLGHYMHWFLSRSHTVAFNNLRESADKGCELCQILQQVCQMRWGPTPEDGLDPVSHAWSMPSSMVEVEAKANKMRLLTEAAGLASSFTLGEAFEKAGHENGGCNGLHIEWENLPSANRNRTVVENDSKIKILDDTESASKNVGVKLGIILEPGKSLYLTRTDPLRLERARGMELYTRIGTTAML